MSKVSELDADASVDPDPVGRGALVASVGTIVLSPDTLGTGAIGSVCVCNGGGGKVFASEEEATA